MSETEVLVRERKKKRQQILGLPPKEEESSQEYSTRDEEPEARIRAREEQYTVKHEIKEETEKARIQHEIIQQERERMWEENHNKRIALYNQTKSELANMVKAVLSDQTIKLGKGKQTTRQHKKLGFGLYHKDVEESVEIELRRSGVEENE